MNYLLDTHTAMWALSEKNKLSKIAKSIIDNTNIPLYISVVSAWEVAIKISIGKSELQGGVASFLEKMKENGVEVLELKDYHISNVEKMPYLHRDPFDRMLISIALTEGLTILTADVNIHKYDVSWCW